jgi:hypothetical protein
MLDAESKDIFDPNNNLDAILEEDEEMFESLQWHAERSLLEVLLTPAKAPLARPIDYLVNYVVDNPADAIDALVSLQHDGLIRVQGEYVIATKAAVSFWRLELANAGPRQ